MTVREQKIAELREEIQSRGQMGLILRTTEEAALDFFNRLDPNLLLFVVKAWNEFETHADTMKQSLDDLKAAAERIRPTLPPADSNADYEKLLDLLVKDGLFSEYEIGTSRQELQEVFAQFLPQEIIKKAEHHIDLFESLHPVTMILRKEYEKDEERAEQNKAGGHLLGMILDDETDSEKAEDHVSGLTYTEYVNTITKEDLDRCAKVCKKARRHSWGNQFAALAEVWEDYDTRTRKKALKDELTIERRLTFEASIYLYRCVMARLENQQPGTIPDEPALPVLSYISHNNDLTAGISKLNSIFGFLDLVPLDGQTRIDIQTDKDKDGNQLFTFYSATFEGGADITYSRPLDARDDWYLSFAGQFYEEGQYIFSKRQFYKKIFRKDPSKTQLKNFSEAIEIMMKTQVNITNEIIDEDEEGHRLIGDAATDRPKYPTRKRTKYSYKGALLPCEIIEATDPHTGKVIKDAIHIFRYPPTLEYAKTRGEIMSVDPELLLVKGVSFTAKTAALHKMLLTRIAKLRRQENMPQYMRNTSPKYLKDTLYEQCHIRTATDKKNVKRAGTIEKILDHYKEKGHIKGWREYEDSFTIQI